MDLLSNFYSEITVALSALQLEQSQVSQLSGNELEQLCIYAWNIALSQSLYPVLHMLEITLRNNLHQAISIDTGCENWYVSDLILKGTHERQMVEVVLQKMYKQNKKVLPEQVITKLNFGFWASLLDVRYEYNQLLWPRLLRTVFPYAPRAMRCRKRLSKLISDIRRLRNYVFHHEPIWNWGDLREQHNNILDLIDWLSPKALAYLELFNQFNEIYAQGIGQYHTKIRRLLITHGHEL